jgi:hypothetical protein
MLPVARFDLLKSPTLDDPPEFGIFLGLELGAALLQR